MARKSRENNEIKEFIINNVADNPGRVTALTVEKFGLSRSSVCGYMNRLIKEGILESKGNTNARSYGFKLISDVSFKISLSLGLAEHSIWQFRILPYVKNVKKNVVDICQYGFTEMLNNAIDHSASFEAFISYQQTYNTIEIMIADHGVGIFQKIQKDFHLPDARSALLELSKGKLTSDKKNHAGEGIFYTSRMFDDFSITSDCLYYRRKQHDDDQWLIETEDKSDEAVGTCIIMKIATDSTRTTRSVFDKYQKEGNRFLSFRKTHVPLKLGKYLDEQLVSRSQAKRVLSRFEDFTEVLLDFDGVQEIGQGFADEIFRVFKNEHPNINIISVRTTPEIDKMIEHVKQKESEDHF